MIYLASAAAAIIPMLLYLVFIWKLDRYEREPFGFVFKNYLWGAFGAIFLTLVFGFFFSAFASVFIPGKNAFSHFETIIAAPVVEELMKGVFLFITINNRKFDNLTDGLVYGGAIGLGFGMTENFLYFITYGSNLNDWITLVIMRTLFSAAMHCVSTASFGAFLSYTKYLSGAKKIFTIIAGFAVAILIHFTWNLSVSLDSSGLIGVISLLVIFTVFGIMFLISVFNEKKIIYRELLEEVNSGLIPADHLKMIHSSHNKLKLIPPVSDQRDYQSAAIKLAFRKYQLRNSINSDRYYYEEDIKYYRNFIRELLTQSTGNE